MFGLFRRKKHKRNHFTKRRVNARGQYEYYNQNLEQWMLWSSILDDTDFKSENDIIGSTTLCLEFDQIKYTLTRGYSRESTISTGNHGCDAVVTDSSIGDYTQSSSRDSFSGGSSYSYSGSSSSSSSGSYDSGGGSSSCSSD